MSKRQKRFILYALPVVTLLLVLMVAKRRVDQVDLEAQVLAETGKGVLQLLAEYGAGLAAGDIDQVMACYTETASSAGFWQQRVESSDDGVELAVWQNEGVDGDGGESVKSLDRVALRQRLEAYLQTLGTLQQSKLKLAKIESMPAEDQAVVRSILWLRGRQGDGLLFESQATLRLTLHKELDGWRIQHQELVEGQTVRGTGRGFSDVAAAAGIDFAARRNPAFETDAWRPERFEIIKYGTAGVSTVDYDGDGWYDLFFGDGDDPRLYRNRGDGTFEDVSRRAGLPSKMGGTNIGLFADFDNDGDPDLFWSGFTRPNLLLRNDGDGTFSDVTEGAGVGGFFATAASAADYDGDGLTDLYIGRYLDPRVHLPTTLFYTRNGEGNVLLRNLGDLRFADVTAEAGVREGGLTLGVTWADYDEDGDQDLYVANDFGRNALLANQGDGTFRDVSAESGALDFGFGMSASFADLDNDLDLDLYISNVHSGQRWYGQAATLYQYLLTSLRQGTLVEDFPLYREIYGYIGDDWSSYGDRMVKGNSLLLNDGGTFRDVAETAHANPFGWYWGSTVFDFDNDGLQDVYAANGWITATSKDDL